MVRTFTRKGPKALCHMPHTSDSTYKGPYATKALLEASHARAQRTPEGDPEFETGSRIEFGNHSLRRFADKIATASKSALNILSEEIDAYFGWKETEAIKSMQRHYAQMNRADRVKMARLVVNI